MKARLFAKDVRDGWMVEWLYGWMVDRWIAEWLDNSLLDTHYSSLLLIYARPKAPYAG